MFPQLVETIYSPALPDISFSFCVSTEQAAQTLSIYFIAFAAGVTLWGYLSDRIGRRPAILWGLLCYGIGTLMAIATANFHFLLLSRVVSAIGAAAGSVVVQAILRDSYESTALAHVFSVIGTALALSPVIGLMSGGWLVSLWGHMGIFILLLLMAILLFALTLILLPETRPIDVALPHIGHLAANMLRDSSLWLNALLVALFNAMLFSYYSLAPSLFLQLGWSSKAFGWTGLLLAFASLISSLLNQRLLASGIYPTRLVQYASILAVLSGFVAWVLQASSWVLVPVMGIIVSYGLAIPNVLSQALWRYREQAGVAGALFGLNYYLMLGLLLGLAGLVQQLGFVLAVCALIAWACSLLLKRSQ